MRHTSSCDRRGSSGVDMRRAAQLTSAPVETRSSPHPDLGVRSGRGLRFGLLIRALALGGLTAFAAGYITPRSVRLEFGSLHGRWHLRHWGPATPDEPWAARLGSPRGHRPDVASTSFWRLTKARRCSRSSNCSASTFRSFRRPWPAYKAAPSPSRCRTQGDWVRCRVRCSASMRCAPNWRRPGSHQQARQRELVLPRRAGVTHGNPCGAVRCCRTTTNLAQIPTASPPGPRVLVDLPVARLHEAWMGLERLLG